MKKKNKNKLFIILGIIGPGLITVNAGNDAGGITTYATVGASYGYKMLWGLLLITFSLAIIQEMNARMAVVTGKGLSDLIREQYGVKVSFFAIVVLFVANLGVCIGDFAGIAAGLELFGINRYISVPIAAVVIWLVVTKGSYKKTEKIFLAFTFVFFAYIFTTFKENPNWHEVIKATFTPYLSFDKAFIITFIGMIGTTITPYMQFYLQSAIVDKRLTVKELKYEKLDVYLGAIWGDLVSFFIIVGTAITLYKFGINIDSAQQAALALKPIAGSYATILFGAGLLGASVLAATIIPLSTTYAICEFFGVERGMDNSFNDAPAFYIIFTLMIGFSALIILIPHISLIGMMLVSQQFAGILSPIILIFMALLSNNPDIMGKYTSGKTQNIIIWITITFIVLLSIAFVVSSFI